MFSTIKREIRHTGVVALYLFCAFGFFATIFKLTLAIYEIEASALLPTVIFTLVLAKVVVLLDLTPISIRLDTRHPIWVATLCKSLLYSTVCAPVLFAQRAWHIFRENGALGGAFVEAWHQTNPNRVLARFMVLILVLGCYHLYRGIDRRLGQGSLRHIIFSG